MCKRWICHEHLYFRTRLPLSKYPTVAYFYSDVYPLTLTACSVDKTKVFFDWKILVLASCFLSTNACWPPSMAMAPDIMNQGRKKKNLASTCAAVLAQPQIFALVRLWVWKHLLTVELRHGVCRDLPKLCTRAAGAGKPTCLHSSTWAGRQQSSVVWASAS